MSKHATHRASARLHAERRAMERFENMTPELLKKIKRVFKRSIKKRRVLRDGRAHSVRLEEEYFEVSRVGTRIKAIIVIEGIRYCAVYDERLKSLVTVMDPSKHHGVENGEL